MEALEQKCGNCRFIRTRTYGETTVLECRTNPPNFNGKWPEIGADEWCGKWEEIPAPEVADG